MTTLLAVLLSLAAAQSEPDHARQERLYAVLDAAVQGPGWNRLGECVENGRTVFAQVGKDAVLVQCARFVLYGRPIGVSEIATAATKGPVKDEDAAAAAGMLVAHYRDIQAQARAYQVQIDIGEAFQRMAR